MAATGLRERHTARTRDAIVTAAIDLFQERGFAATTVDDIAARADVAPRTFFRYFPTKESILFHDTETKLGMMREMLLARPIDEPAHLSLIAVFGARREDLAADPAK